MGQGEEKAKPRANDNTQSLDTILFGARVSNSEVLRRSA
jgi:hypothetical protein